MSISSLLRLTTIPPPSILFLGEGDFSFSSSLLSSLQSTGTTLSPYVHPTAFDSRQVCLKKYGTSASLSTLESLGCPPWFQVDATDLKTTIPGSRPGGGYDRVIWMFPHSGEQRVHVNRHLIVNFFRSVGPVLSQNGFIYVTLTDGRPYSDWRLEEAAEASDFKLRRMTSWSSSSLPGYCHVTTLAGSAFGGTHATMETKGILGSKIYAFSRWNPNEKGYDERTAAAAGKKPVQAKLSGQYQIMLANDSEDGEEGEDKKEEEEPPFLSPSLPPANSNENKKRKKKGGDRNQRRKKAKAAASNK